MTLSYTYNGAAVTHNIQPSGINIPSRAENGDVGTGGIPMEDPSATLLTVGHKSFYVEESACAQPRLWTGWTTQRDMGRSLDRGMFVGENARLTDTTIVDLNACLNFRLITGADGNRPSETWNDRIAWLLASDYLDGLIENDTTFVDSRTIVMDAADYRDQAPASVLDDLNDRTGGVLNYFVFWDPVDSDVKLFMKRTDETTYSSTLQISNDPADVDSTVTFYPNTEATLARQPDQTYSGVVVQYTGGRLYRSRPSSVTAFIRRETTISRPYTKSATTAASQAEGWLTEHAFERDRITVTIRVPAASAGLVLAGERIRVRFTHLPGYETWTWMRVVTCTPTPIDDIAVLYDIALELVGSQPEPDTEPAFACLSWGHSDASTPPGPYTWGVMYPPDIVTFGHNGNFWHSGDPARYMQPLSGPLQYVRGDFTTDAPGPYTDGYPFADRGVGIKCLADGVVDVEFACTAIEVWLTSIDIQIRLNNTPVGTLTVDDPANGGVLSVFDLAVADGDVITAWVSDLVGVFNQISIPSGVGAAAREHLIVEGVMGGGGGGSDDVVPLPPDPTGVLNNYAATTDPTDDDDADDGYQVGSQWVNVSTGDAWVLVDSTVGGAVWVLTTGGGTGFVTVIDGGKETVSTVAASGATETLDLGDGNVHDLTLTDDCTLTFAGATAGVACSMTLLLRQDGTGGWDTTWPGSVVWAGGTAPTLDTTASTVAVLTFFTLDGGTVWYGFPTGGGGGGTPATTVTDETTWGITPAVGSDDEYARQDHTHGTPAQPTGGSGELLITDTPAGSPLIFADILQNEAGTDLLYSD